MMKNRRRVPPLVALIAVGLSLPAAFQRLAVSAITPPPAAVPAATPAAPSKITPDQRRQLFFQLLQDTFKESGIRPDGLIMIGTGSWMSTDPKKRGGSRDIDATIAYLNDTLNQDEAWKFKQKFDELKEKLKPTYGELDITLFSDIRSGVENEPDYYHGPVGQYFLRLHSNANNPNSSFDLTPGKDPTQQPTDYFWGSRNQDPPNSIEGAYVFVDDNRDFLDAHLKNQSTVEQAKLIGKYVQRVEVTLKQAIREKWGVDLPSTNPRVTDVTTCLGKIKNSNGDFELLEAIPGDEIEADVRKCLGIGPDDDLKKAVDALHSAATDYFNSTSVQVDEAEPIFFPVPAPTPIFIPEPTPSNTSAEPAPTNTSAEPVPTNTSAEPAPTNTSAEPAPTNTSAEPAPTNTSAEPAPTNTSA
jgi:hypothetical protein